MAAMVVLLGLAASIYACQWRGTGTVAEAKQLMDAHVSRLNALVRILQRNPGICFVSATGPIEKIRMCRDWMPKAAGTPVNDAGDLADYGAAQQLMRQMPLENLNVDRDKGRLTFISASIFQGSLLAPPVLGEWNAIPKSGRDCQPVRALGWCVAQGDNNTLP